VFYVRKLKVFRGGGELVGGIFGSFWIHLVIWRLVGCCLESNGCCLEVGCWIWKVWGSPRGHGDPRGDITRGVPGFWQWFVGLLGGGRWGGMEDLDPTSHSLDAPLQGGGWRISFKDVDTVKRLIF
jgi:hypothetical protein